MGSSRSLEAMRRKRKAKIRFPTSPLSIFEETLKHEKKVTEMINNLYNLARKVGDNATEIFLQWFVSEQVEEEASASSIVEKLKMVKPGSGALLMLDRALAQRGAH